MNGSIRQVTDNVEAGVQTQLAYIWEHPEWVGSTVHTSLNDVAEGAVALRRLEGLLTGVNSYADGPRPGLDQAFETLATELWDRLHIWTEPLEDERREARDLDDGRSYEATVAADEAELDAYGR